MTRAIRTLLAAALAMPAVALAADVAAVAEADNAFACDLYRQLAGADDGASLFFSPYSVMSALAMTAEGARGETAAEMGAALRLPASLRRDGDAVTERPWDLRPVHRGLAAIEARLAGPDPQQTAELRARIATLRDELQAAQTREREQRADRDWDAMYAAQERARALADELNGLLARVDRHELAVANALWVDQRYPLAPDFVSLIDRHYETGGAFPVDFRDAHEAARQRINGWVADQTRDRIQDLLPPGTVDRATCLVLTNAVYFKGQWSEPFPAEATGPRDFTRADGSVVTVPMMEGREREEARYAAFTGDGTAFDTPRRVPVSVHGDLDGAGNPARYPGDDGFAMVELPYRGGDLAMVVIAPRRHDGLAAIESRLSAATLADWVAQLESRSVHVTMPRFRMETAYRLKDHLQALGMVRAFRDPRRPDGARFQGLTTSTDPADRLFVTAVVHKAFVEVNEKGTEAAAATAVTMARATSVPTTEPFIPEFRADRPFLVLIRDVASGAILFMGRVMEPGA